MKKSQSRKNVKKQAGRDPWGAKDKKRLEAQKSRAQARQMVEKANTTRPRLPATERKPHGRKAGKQAPSSFRKLKLGLLVMVALLIVGFLLTGPVMRNLDATEEIRLKQVEVGKEQAKTEDLRLRKEHAGDLGFLEEEARRIGYVLPGEVPVIVVEEEVQPEATTPGP